MLKIRKDKKCNPNAIKSIWLINGNALMSLLVSIDLIEAEIEGIIFDFIGPMIFAFRDLFLFSFYKGTKRTRYSVAFLYNVSNRKK